MLIDSHCHLTAERFHDDQDVIIRHAREAGLQHLICIGTGCDDGERALALSRAHPGLISASVGLDPFSAHAAGDAFAEQLARLQELIVDGHYVALGEIGLDYHYDLGPKQQQWQRCAAQLDLAVRSDLPVVIHVREAFEDMLALLREHPRARGVIHSFTGDPEQGAAFLELGWFLGFNGIVTFKNAGSIAEAAAACPADRLLLETDSPYLAPVPKRGKRCEPAFLPHTAAHVAALRGERLDDVAAWSTRNARQLFRLD
ncbi:MAG: TatD family hydrolase [Planctomycetota bacterium]